MSKWSWGVYNNNNFCNTAGSLSLPMQIEIIIRTEAGQWAGQTATTWRYISLWGQLGCSLSREREERGKLVQIYFIKPDQHRTIRQTWTWPREQGRNCSIIIQCNAMQDITTIIAAECRASKVNWSKEFDRKALACLVLFRFLPSPFNLSCLRSFIVFEYYL